jgi:hypothetical protein
MDELDGGSKTGISSLTEQETTELNRLLDKIRD